VPIYDLQREFLLLARVTGTKDGRALCDHRLEVRSLFGALEGASMEEAGGSREPRERVLTTVYYSNRMQKEGQSSQGPWPHRASTIRLGQGEAGIRSLREKPPFQGRTSGSKGPKN